MASLFQLRPDISPIVWAKILSGQLTIGFLLYTDAQFFRDGTNAIQELIDLGLADADLSREFSLCQAGRAEVAGYRVHDQILALLV